MKRIFGLMIVWCLLCISFASAQEDRLIPAALEPITLENIDRLVELATIAPSATQGFNYPFDLSINADNTLLAGTNFQRNVWYWDLRTGEMVIVEQNDFGDTASFIAFSPTKPEILATCDRLWDLRENVAIEYFPDFGFETEPFCSLDATFSPDGSQLVMSGPVALYNILTRSLIYDIESLPVTEPDVPTLTVREPVVVDINFSPDGSMIAYTSNRSIAGGEAYYYHVRLIDVQAGVVSNVIYISDLWVERASSVAFSPNSALLAIGRVDGVTLWDLEADNAITETDAVWNNVEFSADGEVVFISDEDGLRAWQYATDEIMPISDDASQVMVLSYDGRLLAVLDSENNIHLWGVPVEG